MLAFVTSLRARELAHDWAYHLRLLDRTLASFLAQTDPDIRVGVVANEVPDVSVRDPRVHFLTVDRPPPPRDFEHMTMDKVFKVSAGARWAIAEGCRFLMYADADDLVSRRLSAWTHQHPDANGWYFEEGFSHHYGDPWLRRSRGHHMQCGTCAIFRADHLRFEVDPVYHGESVNSQAAIGHTYYREVMERDGHPLERLPFPGSIYLQHRDSVVATRPAPVRSGSLIRRSARQLRDVARGLPDLRLLTPRLAREFTIDRSQP